MGLVFSLRIYVFVYFKLVLVMGILNVIIEYKIRNLFLSLVEF